jgi:hypothetical protein
MSVGCTFSSHTEDGARPSKALLIQLESHSLFNSDTLLFTYMMGWIAKGNFSVVLVLQTSVIQKVQWTVWVSHCWGGRLSLQQACFTSVALFWWVRARSFNRTQKRWDPALLQPPWRQRRRLGDGLEVYFMVLPAFACAALRQCVRMPWADSRSLHSLTRSTWVATSDFSSGVN